MSLCHLVPEAGPSGGTGHRSGVRSTRLAGWASRKRCLAKSKPGHEPVCWRAEAGALPRLELLLESRTLRPYSRWGVEGGQNWLEHPRHPIWDIPPRD